MTCTIVKTWLILTIINIGLALFASVTRLTGAQEVINEVCAGKVVFTWVGITVVDF